MTTDFKAMRAKAKLPERTVPICLRGDLIAEFEELERRLQETRGTADSGDSKEGGADVAIAEQMQALRTEMAENTYVFRLRALPGPKYRELKAHYPPRRTDDGEVVPEDVILDADVDAFAEPLMRACLIDPAHDDAEWAETNTLLADSQYNQLINAAVRVNRNGVDIPFSRAASLLHRSTDSE